MEAAEEKVIYSDGLFIIKNTSAVCPYCGSLTDKVKGPANDLEMIDFPAITPEGRPKIRVRRFLCKEPSCKHFGKSFRDTLNGYLPLTGRLPISLRFLDYICVLYSVLPLEMTYYLVNIVFSKLHVGWLTLDEFPAVIKKNRILDIAKKHPYEYPLIVPSPGGMTMNILEKQPGQEIFHTSTLKHYDNYRKFISLFSGYYRDSGSVEEYLRIFQVPLSKERLFACRLDFCNEVKDILRRVKEEVDMKQSYQKGHEKDCVFYV